MQDFNFLRLLICAAGAYLLGSINFGIIITRWFTGLDLRRYGSGNAGTTNAYRMLGAGKTLLVVLGDALKGVLAVFLGWWLFGDYGRICAFMFVIIGHVYPCYFGFKGGKGVLATAAMLAVFDWRLTLILVGIFVVVVLLTRYVSLGSCVAAGCMPFFMHMFFRDQVVFTICSMFISLWIIILHAGNLKRIKNGTESKFNFRHKSPPDPVSEDDENKKD